MERSTGQRVKPKERSKVKCKEDNVHTVASTYNPRNEFCFDKVEFQEKLGPSLALLSGPSLRSGLEALGPSLALLSGPSLRSGLDH